MSSASSTERRRAGRDAGFQPWHFYMLLSLAGATWAVIVSPDTHPAALIMLSAAVVAAGAVGAALHYAIMGFFTPPEARPDAPSDRTREFLQQEKALVLRSIKELEFDRAMGKVSDRDFGELSGRLRARAMEIMERLEQGGPRSSVLGPRSDVLGPGSNVLGPGSSRPESDGPQSDVLSPESSRAGSNGPESVVRSSCPACGGEVDEDARFCKHCGAKL